MDGVHGSDGLYGRLHGTLLQTDVSAVMELSPGEKTALNCRVSLKDGDAKSKSDDGQNPLQAPLSVRFRPRGPEWDWSGPVCAAALGSFWIKIRRQGQSGFASSHKQAKGRMLFALAEVQEDSPSLSMCFRRHSADAIPYRIENALHSGALLYSQKASVFFHSSLIAFWLTAIVCSLQRFCSEYSTVSIPFFDGDSQQQCLL